MADVQGPKDHGSGKCREACLRTLHALGLEFLDLYLIHWPGVQGLKPTDERNRELRRQSWTDMEKLYEQGKCVSEASDVCQMLKVLVFALPYREGVLPPSAEASGGPSAHLRLNP